MGITQQIGASSLIKPGVIDNTAARPASPFEGQVIFQKDTDQLLVWNGTAWVIPNSPAQNPQGLELISSTTVGTTVTSVNLTGVFSSTYDSYRVVFRTNSATGNSNFLMRFGTGTAVATNYKSYLFTNNTAWTTGGSVQVTDTTGALFTYAHPTSITGNADINGPNLATTTTTFGQYATSDNGGFTAGIQTDSTQFTSLHLLPTAGTFTGGLVTVYGYRK